MHILLGALSALTLLSRTRAAIKPSLPEPTSPFLSANQIAPLGYIPIPTPAPDLFELKRRDLSNTCGFNNGTAGVTCAPNYYCTTSSSYFGCCNVDSAGGFDCSLYTACVDYNDISAACPSATCSYPLTNCPSSAPECATFLVLTTSDTLSLAYSNFVCSTSKTILYYSPTIKPTTKVQTSVQTSVQTTVQTSVQTITATPSLTPTPTTSSSSSTAFTTLPSSTLTFTSSTPPPSIIVGASSSAPATAAGASASSTSGTAPVQKSTSSSHTGAIAGGVVGGVVGLALIGGLIAFILYRMKKKRDEAAWDDAPEMSGHPY